MSLATLAQLLTAASDDRVRWKLVWEFLEEYRWEPTEVQVSLVRDEPEAVGDERWDALLAALAEHMNARHDVAPPAWAESRVLRRPRRSVVADLFVVGGVALALGLSQSDAVSLDTWAA